MLYKLSQYQNEWTFKTWLNNFKDVDLPIGDLAREVLEDEDFPNDIEGDDFVDIYDHLQKKRANVHVLEALPSIWNFYLLST